MRKQDLANGSVLFSGDLLCQRSYPGGNRIVAGESFLRPRRLFHRRQLMTSWPYIRGQGSVCSPVKAVREPGLERREPVRLLPTGIAGCLKGRLF